VSLPQPGYYVYTVRLSGGAFVRGTQTSCDDDAQTTRALAPLRLTARANAAVVRVGTDVSATLTVQGAATTAAQVRAELWGPFATPSAIRCVGTPSWSGTLPLANGAQRTPPVRVSAPGYYAFRATTAPDATHGGAATPCGDRAATTHVTLPPAAAVRIAVDVVRARSKVATVLRLTGTRSPTTSVAIDVFGPFGSRATVRCAGARSWEGHVVVGTQPTARITAPVGKPGFYAIGARVSDSGGDLGSVPGPSCSRSRSRVILAAPRIITGGRILSSGAAAAAARVGAPTRVRIASPAIDARVYPVAIDTRNGVLAVPASLSRAGWWRDGAAPGARSGAVLIAAHVDSARGGEGAFFRLHRVRPGEQVQLSTAGGAAVAYRVVSVRSYRKDALPTGIYSHGGAPRLVLVTCGGPFDRASGRYRDNIVVTAVPVEATPSRARGSAAARR
jgi:hypothetical protein